MNKLFQRRNVYLVIRPKLSDALAQGTRCCNYATINAKMTNESKAQSTVDEKDVEFHSKHHNEWWDPSGAMKGLHAMNRLRVPFIRDGLLSATQKKPGVKTAKPLLNYQILDIGCGGGILSEPLARLGATVTGVDASSELISVARAHAALEPSLSEENPCYINSTIEEHASQNKSCYDAVTASEILEHVADKEYFIKSCVDALKPGGSIFITAINKTTLSWLGGIIFAERVAGLLPVGTHEWDKFISPTETSRLLESNNCKTLMVHGMTFLFLNNSWYWISDTSINYAIHAIKHE